MHLTSFYVKLKSATLGVEAGFSRKTTLHLQALLAPSCRDTPTQPPTHSPRDHDDEVHDVPHVPEVAARVEHEALREDLEARLDREDAQEVGLGRFLQDQCRGGL